MAVQYLHPGAVVHIALLATAIEVVNQDIGAVHLHMGAVIDLQFYIRLAVSARGFDGRLLLCQHVAFVAAAVNGADTSRGQGKGRDAFHVGAVVASKKGTYIVDARTVPRIVGFNGFVGQISA